VPKKTILTVDDDPDMLEFIRLYLEPEGYAIVAVKSGPAALRWLADSAPDLILLDVGMPGVSGFDVCRQIRENDKTRRTPVIFLTQKDRPEDYVKGRVAGGDLYLLKPVLPNRLVSTVAMLLS
jgi:two-component system phosphate regulon response regulator PhoB